MAASLWTGCAAAPVPAPVTPQYAAALPGNWLLTGTLRAQKVLSPVGTPVQTTFAISMDIVNGQVLAAASFEVPCTNSTGTIALASLGGNVLTGSLAADGTLTLPATTSSQTIAPTFTITGTGPARPGAPWNGTLTITETTPAAGLIPACSVNQTIPFTATAIADVNGAFTGSGTAMFLAGPPGSHPVAQSVPLTLTATLSQGGAAYFPLSSTPIGTSRLGLNGTLDVQGIPCFKHGSSAGLGGGVEGSGLLTRFVMDDGSTATLDGSIDDIATDELSGGALSVVGGNCAGTYSLISWKALLKQ